VGAGSYSLGERLLDTTFFRYWDEAMFRFNNRATMYNPLNDADRFDAAVRQIVGKRLTYKELTGKTDAARNATPEAF